VTLTGLSASTVARARKELEAKGHIRCVRKGSSYPGKPRRASAYEVNVPLHPRRSDPGQREPGSRGLATPVTQTRDPRHSDRYNKGTKYNGAGAGEADRPAGAKGCPTCGSIIAEPTLGELVCTNSECPTRRETTA
jgi:hypothetical protein